VGLGENQILRDLEAEGRKASVGGSQMRRIIRFCFMCINRRTGVLLTKRSKPTLLGPHAKLTEETVALEERGTLSSSKGDGENRQSPECGRNASRLGSWTGQWKCGSPQVFQGSQNTGEKQIRRTERTMARSDKSKETIKTMYSTTMGEGREKKESKCKEGDQGSG